METIYTHQYLQVNHTYMKSYLDKEQNQNYSSPLQDLPLAASSYPLLQEHTKLPGVLVHVWLHGDDVHSLISTK